MPDTYVGESYPRLEDEVLLTGGASFVDDFNFPGMLQAAFVRSPVAHARIKSIDVGGRSGGARCCRNLYHR